MFYNILALGRPGLKCCKHFKNRDCIIFKHFIQSGSGLKRDLLRTYLSHLVFLTFSNRTLFLDVKLLVMILFSWLTLWKYGQLNLTRTIDKIFLFNSFWILCRNFIIVRTCLFILQDYFVSICPNTSFDAKIEYVDTNEKMYVT